MIDTNKNFREVLQYYLFLSTSVTAIINLPIFYFYIENKTFTFALFFISLIYILLLIFKKYNLYSYRFRSNVFIITVFIHLLLAPIFNGVETFAIIWFAILPIAIYCLKRPREALLQSIIMLVIFNLLYFFAILEPSYLFLQVAMVSMIYSLLVFFLTITSIILETQSNKLTAINTTLEDRINKAIKEKHKQEKAMIQQSRLAQMGEMLSMIAHQWRQPLTAISASTASLQFDIALDRIEGEKMQKEVSKIEEYTSHLSSTITDFSNFFKPKKEKELTNISTLLDKTKSLSASLFQSNGIALSIHIEETIEINTYSNELVQVMINILNNAVDALLENKVTNPSIQIRGSVQASQHHISIEIEDNAGGISPESIDKVFEPYYSTKSKNGTGLGLYMSKSIIEDHCNGKLKLENRENGACFIITLPYK